VKVTLEYVMLVRRTIWRCAKPCSRICRHRDELPGLHPAVCPSCHGEMNLVDLYYLPRAETHVVHIREQGVVMEDERGML
jgi:hypothetical protein